MYLWINPQPGSRRSGTELCCQQDCSAARTRCNPCTALRPGCSPTPLCIAVPLCGPAVRCCSASQPCSPGLQCCRCSVAPMLLCNLLLCNLLLLCTPLLFCTPVPPCGLQPRCCALLPTAVRCIPGSGRALLGQGWVLKQVGMGAILLGLVAPQWGVQGGVRLERGLELCGAVGAAVLGSLRVLKSRCQS